MRILLIIFMCFSVGFCYLHDYQDVIEKLNTRVSKSQVKEDTTFIPGVRWAKQKGAYPSHVMLNYFGGPKQELLRNNLKFYDNNAFITLWVAILRLEAALLPGGPELDEEELSLTLDAVQSYHDQNEEEGSSILVFWPQELNKTTGLWVCDAANIGAVAADEKVLTDVLAWLLSDLGLKNDSEHLKEFTEFIQSIVNEFHIPADADDTFVNIGLGSLLKKYNYHNTAYSQWSQVNPHIRHAIVKLHQYSYQPFRDTLNNSIIDPRTYFYLRNFFYESENLGNTDLKLPGTWMTSFYENAVLAGKGVRMPFNLNNIDLTVSTNVLYGLTAAVLSDMDNPDSWFDNDMQTLYQSIIDMITYELQLNFSSRPDLALTYYPSKFVFYWFTSRTLQLLKSSEGQLMFAVLEKAFRDLEALLRSNFTDALVKSAIHDKSDMVYYDDFLGGGDKDLFGRPVNHAEDRIFSTSMAANTLLYTWREGTYLSPYTPPAVTTTIRQLCNWLATHTLSGKYKPHNVFFSGSMKSNYQDMALFYPANYQHWLNGTELPKDVNLTYSISLHSAVGMLGMIDEDEYILQLKEKHFGMPTPIDFPGYNTPGFHFPFWSSDELTYSSVVLALTQCQYLFN